MKIRIDKYIMGMALLLLAACAKQPVEPTLQGKGAIIHYRATVSEGTATRATVDGVSQYIFEAGDILYLEGAKMYGSLTLHSGAGETSAVFEGDLICDEGYYPAEGEDLSATLVSEAAVNCGFYTFDANGKLQAPSYPADQFASTFADAVSKYSVFTVDGKYGDSEFVLSQHSTFLVFAVRCDKGKVGVGTNVLVRLYNNGDATPIRSANVQAAEYGAYSRTSFVTALPGGTSLSGASLSLKWGDGTDDHKEFTDITDASLLANKYYNITRDAVVPYAGFRIRATHDATTITLTYSYNNKTNNNNNESHTEYSLDNGNTWQHYTTSFNLNKDEEACIRADRITYKNGGTGQWFDASTNPIFTSDKLVYIAGNIMSLLANGLETGILPSTEVFLGAFSKGKNTAVTYIDIDPQDPLLLPAMTLTEKCYLRMFFNCTSLTTAPALPATTLANWCYYNMFRQCSNLTDVSLIPKLPAETLMPNCYRELFRLCTSLTSVPKDFLPALELKEGCYQQMFQGCSLITQVPDLPAETLVTYCYSEMFKACSSLKSITCRATSGYHIKNTNENFSTNDWVNGVGSGGTFTIKEGATWPAKGNNSIPSNWTVVEKP